MAGLAAHVVQKARAPADGTAASMQRTLMLMSAVVGHRRFSDFSRTPGIRSSGRTRSLADTGAVPLAKKRIQSTHGSDIELEQAAWPPRSSAAAARNSPRIRSPGSDAIAQCAAQAIAGDTGRTVRFTIHGTWGISSGLCLCTKLRVSSAR